MLDGSSTVHRGLLKSETGNAEEPDERRNQSSLHYTLRDKVWREAEPMGMTWKDVCLKPTDTVVLPLQLHDNF